jgi:stage III sporulation protein AB
MESVLLRAASAAMLCLSGYLLGKSLSGAAARRAKTLSELLAAVSSLRGRMLDRLMPVRAALDGNCQAFRRVAQAMEGGKTAMQAWESVKKELTGRGGPLDCLSAEDEAILDGLFLSLGSGAQSEQKRLLDDTEESLKEKLRKAKEDAEASKKLFGKLGALAGLALAIALI